MLESQSPPTNSGDGRLLDHLGSAVDMVAARQFREAEGEVLRALSIAPGDVRALKLLALVRFKLGRLDDARAVCREIAAAHPEDAGIRVKLGLIALKLNRLEESIQELETATRLAPDDRRPWSYLGFAYARRGETARAAAAFRRAGQEGNAAQVESGVLRAPSLEGDDAAATSPGGAAAVPDESGPWSKGPGSEASARPSFAGGDTSSGPAPAPAFEPAFDLSQPGAVRESRTDADYPAGFLAAATGSATVSPLVGYAISRLAPPGDQAARVGATARLAIGEEVFVRVDAAVACAGSPRWESAHRHVRGRPTPERLGGDAHPFCRITGRGEVFVTAPMGRLVPLRLDDDILYIREDRVLAFEGTVSWEYGHVPRGGLRMLQFRGHGLVAISVAGEPGAVKVTPDRPLFASPPHLLGWIGRVVARGDDRGPTQPGSPSPSPFGITCEGEGVVLLDIADKADNADAAGRVTS